MQKEGIEKVARPNADDKELIDVLIAISVVAKRLARKLEDEMSKEGGKLNEQNE